MQLNYKEMEAFLLCNAIHMHVSWLTVIQMLKLAV